MDENVNSHFKEAINTLNASTWEMFKTRVLGKKTIEPDDAVGAVEITEYNGKRYFVRAVDRRE